MSKVAEKIAKHTNASVVASPHSKGTTYKATSDIHTVSIDVPLAWHRLLSEDKLAASISREINRHIAVKVHKHQQSKRKRR